MLTASVKLFVPSTVKVASDAPSALVQGTVEGVMRLFAVLFGGFTMTKAHGGWMSEGFGLVLEEVNIVYSATTPQALSAGLGKVIDRAKDICERFGQECVSLEVNNVLYFVDATTKVTDIEQTVAHRMTG